MTILIRALAILILAFGAAGTGMQGQSGQQQDQGERQINAH